MIIIRHFTDLITKYWKVAVVVEVEVVLILSVVVECVCSDVPVQVAVVALVPLLCYLSRYSASLTGNVAQSSRPSYICHRLLGNVTIKSFLAKLNLIHDGAVFRAFHHIKKAMSILKSV